MQPFLLVSSKNGWSEALRFEGAALEWQTNGIPPIKERAKRSALYLDRGILVLHAC
jgi:hypothetical protein